MIGQTTPLPLLLLPGLDGTGLLFEAFLRRCPGYFEPRVVEYPDDRLLGYDELLPIARAHLPVAGDFLLLGESFSGPLAIRLAASKPPGLKALILCASFATPPRPSFLARLPIGLPIHLGWRSMKLRRHMSGGLVGARVPNPIAEKIEGLDTRVIVHRVRETLRVDVRDALRACPVPILYLKARWDVVVGGHCWKRIHATRPDAEMALLDCPHMLLQTAPREAWEAILGFLQRNGMSMDRTQPPDFSRTDLRRDAMS